MATQVLTDAVVSVNSVDLSDHGTQVTYTLEKEAVDSTAFGDSTRQNMMGLNVISIDLTFLQDFAASDVDATLFAAWNAGTSIAVNIKPTSAATSATNPEYQNTMFVSSYQPFGNSVGEAHTATATFVPAGTDPTRATS